MSIHDFRMVTGPTHTNVIFDAVIPNELSISDEQARKEIAQAVSKLPGALQRRGHHRQTLFGRGDAVMRPLEELSYAELMALFPIALVPHRDEWREQYARERERLLTQLPEDAVFRLSHVGSTAIKGLWAKPTVDMVLEASGAAAFERP